MKDTDKQELRERCLGYSLKYAERTMGSQFSVVDIAKTFYNYISGEDGETNASEGAYNPTPPANTGPGMSMLRGTLLRTRVFSS